MNNEQSNSQRYKWKRTTFLWINSFYCLIYEFFLEWNRWRHTEKKNNQHKDTKIYQVQIEMPFMGHANKWIDLIERHRWFMWWHLWNVVFKQWHFWWMALRSSAFYNASCVHSKWKLFGMEFFKTFSVRERIWPGAWFNFGLFYPNKVLFSHIFLSFNTNLCENFINSNKSKFLDIIEKWNKKNVWNRYLKLNSMGNFEHFYFILKLFVFILWQF